MELQTKKATIRITNPNKVFTPVFNELWKSKERFVVNYGGTGSSKSFSAAQKEVLISCQRKVTTLIIRKVGSTLRDSVIPSFRRRIDEFKLNEFFVYNKTDRELTNKITGSKILFRGLDDPEKMKSIEGLNRIMIEEASELDIEDHYELNRRVRGVPGIQITLNFNPIHESHWLKEYYFDKTPPNCVIIHSTYKDNPFLTDEDRVQIEAMREYNYNQYRVYALGEWGLTENKNPWLFSYKEEKHIGNVEFKLTYPVYLSFDFNREPATCLAFQMSPNKGEKSSFIHVIKEFVIDGQLHELCAQIKSTYPKSILFVTGDASGNKGDVGFTERHATYYTMVQAYLNLSDNQMNLNKKNLEHSDSRNLINTMLYHYPTIKIHPDCKHLRDDVEKATVDETKQKPGMLKKDRKEYKMDVFDGFRYFFQTYFLEYCEVVYMKGIKKE